MEASPAPSTSQNQQRQVAPATGPQIRSRITVVCAECKRLKLKCDRRSPCGSCTKRDTVARCIYSPAAAEKVDLHSLNNRLIQVEALLASIMGQSTSSFPSTNPLVPANLGSANAAPLIGNLSTLTHAQGLTQHVHHHHSAASALSSESISLAPKDLASIWLDDLEAALPLHTHPVGNAHLFSNEEHRGQIKLEPTPFDVELSRLGESTSANVIDVDQASLSSYPLHDSTSPTPPRRQSVSVSARPSPPILLPALSIYYPVPAISPPTTSTSSSAVFPRRPTVDPGASLSSTIPSTNTGSGLSPATAAAAQYARPQVTPALLQLLPPVPTCEEYLDNAHDVAFSIRPVPFQYGWKDFRARCLALLIDDGQLRLEREMKRERREKEKEKTREARLARKVYFSGIHGLPDTEMNENEAAGSSRSPRSTIVAEAIEDEHSLPFFAAMCNVLAIGAFVTPPSASFPGAAQDAPSFLHALAQQALGVWDTARAGAQHSQHECEKLDYVLACLLGCGYLLLSLAAKKGPYGDENTKGSSSGSYISPGFESPIVALVGKLVTAARALDLGGETISGMRRSGIALSVNTDNSGSGKQTRKEREAEKERLKEEWKRAMWWDVMWYDLFTTDAFGHQAHIPSSMYASAQPPPCAAYPASASPPTLFLLSGDDDNADDEDSDGLEDGEQSHPTPASSTADSSQMAVTASPPQNVQSAVQPGDAYLGARHRLIQLVYRIRSRLAQPDCCCGYTLDQAAELESHIKRWQSELPFQLRYSSVEDLGVEQLLGIAPADRILLAQSCELAVITNLLIVRVYAPFLRKHTPGSHTMQVADSESSCNPPALLAILYACQAMTRAMSDLRSIHSPAENRQVSKDHRKSDVLPHLFDIYPPEKVVFDSVIICAHTALISKGRGSAFDIANLTESISTGLDLLANAPLAVSNRKIVAKLKMRIGSGGGGLKRKYSQVDISSTSTMDQELQGATDRMAVAETRSAASTQQLGAHQGHLSSAAQQYHNPIIQLPPSSPVVTATPTSPVLPRNPELKLRGADKPDRPTQSVAAVVAQSQIATPAKTSVETAQKEKKAKKSAPVVGIRVRPGKQPEKLRTNTQQPLMTLAPRPMPNAEAVRLYKQKLQLQTGPSTSPQEAVVPPSSTPLQEQDTHHGDATMRSRSSSASFQTPERRPESMNPYPTFFNQQIANEVSNSHNAQTSSFPHGQQHSMQQVQGCAETPQGPFTHQSYHQSQPMEYTPGTTSTSANDPMNYSSNVSSPFTNPGPPASESSSPFTAGSAASPGHPSTPAFTTHSSLPVFGPQPEMSLNSASYMQIIPSSGPFEAHYGPISAYSGQHQQALTGMSLSDVVMDQGMSGPSMYSNSRQQHPHQMQGPSFEIKPVIAHHPQADVHSHTTHQQTMNERRPSEVDHDMSHQSHHGSIDMGVAGSWPGHNHSQMSENPSSLQQSYQWNNGEQYQYYH